MSMEVLYQRRHSRVHATRGRAKTYKCVDCGGPAFDWSQRHGTDGWDVNDYDPRCRKCHRAYDGSPCLGRKASDEARAKMSEAARNMDPETRARLSKIRAANAKRVTSRARKCTECGKISSPAGIGRHHQVSGHSGHEDLDQPLAEAKTEKVRSIKIAIYQTLMMSDAQRGALARLIDETEVSTRLATREEAKEFIWSCGARWEDALGMAYDGSPLPADPEPASDLLGSPVPSEEPEADPYAEGFDPRSLL